MPGHDEEQIRRIEELVRELEAIPDPSARQKARQLMEAVLELHGAGLERVMEIAAQSGGEDIIRQFSADSLVASLLVLHGLHPDDLETRARRAVAKLHGSVELLGVNDGVIRARIVGTGCGLKQAALDVIQEAAPDAADILIEEASQPNGFVPLANLQLGLAKSG